MFKHSVPNRIFRHLIGIVAVLFATVGIGAFAVPRTTPAGVRPPRPPADPAIAFVRADSVKTLMVMNADGSNPTAVHTMIDSAVSGPFWSPDGASIAFTDSGDLWRIDVSVVNGIPRGTNATRLLDSPEATISSPAWSPAGDQIAFVDVLDDTIQTIPAGGGTPSVLLDLPSGVIFNPCWSGDGGRIAFAHDTVGGTFIRVLELSSGSVSDVLGGPSFNAIFLDWGRTADVITFSDTIDGSGSAIYTVDLAGGGPSPVLTGGMMPNWSPDDSKLMFVERTGNRRLKIVNLTTGAVTRLSSTNASWPDWRRF